MKGLIFSQSLIPAWLAGNKTVSRRLINPQPDGTWEDGRPWWNIGGLNGGKPRYQPGETVYIKEWWAQDLEGEVFYRADHDIKPSTVERWRSPLFMPEQAARSHALVISVRPERIRDITHDDVLAEGIPFDSQKQAPAVRFCMLWESLHKGSWNENSWIWRYELEKRP